MLSGTRLGFWFSSLWDKTHIQVLTAQIYWLMNPRCVKSMTDCFTTWKTKHLLQPQTRTFATKYILTSISVFLSFFFSFPVWNDIFFLKAPWLGDSLWFGKPKFASYSLPVFLMTQNKFLCHRSCSEKSKCALCSLAVFYPRGYLYVVKCSAGSCAPGSQPCSETQHKCMENTLRARSAIHHLRLQT